MPESRLLRRRLRRIYPVPLKPPSAIRTWSDWPADVVDTLHYWNGGKYWRSRGGRRDDALSFVVRCVFKCADCEEFCEPQPYGSARLDGDDLCDDCLIARARGAVLEARHV